MKKAVIVIGGHHAGKSDTVNNHLKPMLKRPNGKPMTYDSHNFLLNGKRGYILSQSFEENLKLVLEHSKKYFHYDLLVLAARPETETGSKANELRDVLSKASFDVFIVRIDKSDDRAKKAKEIFDALSAG